MSDLDNAIKSINESAAKAENTATFLDDMSTFDDQSSVTNPNNGQTVASIPKQVKDRTDELFTTAESDINQAVSDAEQSATDAQDAADSIGRYQGLWPDTGGIADKGDTYQTQVSGNPTGQYFTALQNTTVDPVGDDVNWREVVSVDSFSRYTDIVYKASGGNSAVDNMVDEFSSNPLRAAIGSILKTGGTTWEYQDSTGSITIENFRALGALNVIDFGAKGDGVSDDTSAFKAALLEKGEIIIPTGDYLITEPLNVIDRGITKISGSGIGSTKLFFDITGTEIAINVETYYTRKCTISGLQITHKEQSGNTSKGMRVAMGDNSWGAAVKLDNVRIDGFRTETLILHEAFNCEFEGCYFAIVIGDDSTGSILRTTYSTTFGNNQHFRNCTFNWGATAVWCQGSTTMTFESCTFESIKLFNSTEQLAGISIYQIYDNCWFENYDAGLVNAEIDPNTLLPILPVQKRANIDRFKFKNCISSGAFPTAFLNADVEPYYVDNFKLDTGLVIANQIGVFQDYFEINNGESPSDPTIREISQNIDIAKVAFRNNAFKQGVIKLIVRATGLNNSTMVTTLETSTYYTPCGVVTSIRDDDSIGDSYKIDGLYTSGTNVRVRAKGKGVHKLEVLFSSIS